jgi:purine-nucleoside phosphorylase
MTESIIQPQMFKLPGLTRDIVLFFNLQHFMTFHKRVNGTAIKSFGPAKRFQWQNGHRTLTALGGMIGAPLTILIIEMAMASGAETIYSYGSAGSTGAETLTIGELVTPENGYDETGICRDYGNSEPFQPIVPYFSVRTCRAITSVNSFFRLAPENVERYRKSGIQLIDMEAAPLNCVINKLGKTFRPLFVVSDRVSTTMEWENGGNSDSFKEGFESGLNLIAEI